MKGALHCSEDEDCIIQALHGFGGDGLDFSLIESYSSLGWSRVDLLGHGHSRKSTKPEDFEVNVQMSLLAKHAKGNVLLGYSMGARLALQAMLHCPNIWNALILISGTAGIRAGRSERVEWDRALVERLRNWDAEEFWKYWTSLPLISTQQRADPVFIRARAKRREALSMEVLAASVEGFGAGVMPSIWCRLSELTIPVLLIVGEEDEKYIALAEDLKLHLLNASVQMIVVAGAGHAPHFEKPRTCAECIDEWVSTLPL